MSCGVPGRTRLAAYVQIGGPLLLLSMTPAIWFGGLAGGGVLAFLPLIVVIRRCLRLPVSLPGIAGILTAFAFWTLVTALAVRDWQTAPPKLFGVLLGLALVYLLGVDPSSIPRIRGLWLGVAIGLTGVVALAALFLTEWPHRKLLPFDDLYAVLPEGPRVVYHGSRLGGVGPNQIGGLLALLSPLSFALSLDSAGSGRLVRAITVFVLALALTVLLFTQSRSAYVGALIGLALVGWWRLSRCAWVRQRRLRRLALHGSVAVGLAILVAAIADTWLAPLDSTSDTLAGRLRIWTASCLLIGDHLFSGVGPGQFPLVLNANFPELAEFVAPHIPHAHNLALQALLDLGLPGSVLLALLIALAVRGLFATMRMSRNASIQLLAVGLGGSLLAYLVYGLTDAIAPGARGGLPFWLILGLALACGRLRDQAQVTE